MTTKNINSSNHLTPIFKWTGGKRREIKFFDKFFPDFIHKPYLYIEPFVGAGAVYWYLNNQEKNIINDFDDQVINFYKEFSKNGNNFEKQLHKIGMITDHDELEEAYYKQRNKDKSGGLNKLSTEEMAIRFYIINQLAFSGMRRFNSSGEFNVPFGHYKKLNADIIGSSPHKKLLKKTIINQGDFESIMRENDQTHTFMFLDPPYTSTFKEYSANNSFEEADQIRLAKTIKDSKKASIMLIINRSPFIEELYDGLIKASYDIKYGVNIKNRFNTATEHLIICNY